MNNLLSLLFLVFIISCNNSGVSEKEVVNDKETGGQKKSSGAAGSCSNLVFFQPGTEIEATSYDQHGKESARQVTKVLNVTQQDGFTIANVEGVNTDSGNDKSTTVHYQYKCDGNSIYFDLASLFRTAQKEEDMTFTSSMIEYPFNVQEGQHLPDVTGSMTSMRNGNKMEMKFTYEDRKVDGTEKVTTSAGTWNCIKISNNVKVEMDFPGLDENSKKLMKQMQKDTKTTNTTWFAPDFGIVKSENYRNGQLQSKNEVTAVKKQ